MTDVIIVLGWTFLIAIICFTFGFHVGANAVLKEVNKRLDEVIQKGKS